ncbi:protein kinase [bacterium]|nr:protein kinase [bacterium]MBP9809971.1 protein kinase [bacterium]
MSDKVFKEEQKEKVYLSEKCTKCQKPITPESRAGSFTSFLFGANRCSCNNPLQLKVVTSTTSAQLTSAGVTESGYTGDKPDLGERYEVLDLIGQGGMGAVWKVRDTAINKTLAIKVLRKELANDRLAVKRFEQEANAAACLTHANLVTVYGSGAAKDNSPYLIMDYINGECLADLLHREVYLSVPQALDITSQICEALAHAHAKGIVHRDLKPSNIMLTKSADGNDIVKIVDFGIAKLMPSINEQANNLTQTGELFGSPLYMSPEQCKGETVDARSDVYSLGCIMYEMLTGKPAFPADNPIKIILKHLSETPKSLCLEFPSLEISNELSLVVMQCLEIAQEQRYASADALRMDLERLRNGQRPQLTKEITFLAAPVWRRAAANLIDGSIIGIFSCLLTFAMLSFIFPNSATFEFARNFQVSMSFAVLLLEIASFAFNLVPLWQLSIESLNPSMSMRWMVMTTLFIYLFMVNWLYQAIFDSSPLKGTPGKLLMGLQITDYNHNKISFGKSSLRYLLGLGVFGYYFAELFYLPLISAIVETNERSRQLQIRKALQALTRPTYDTLSQVIVSGVSGKPTPIKDSLAGRFQDKNLKRVSIILRRTSIVSCALLIANLVAAISLHENWSSVLFGASFILCWILALCQRIGQCSRNL